MKLILSMSLSFCLLHTPAFAIGTDVFGLDNTEAACLFVKEAEDIANVDERARYSCGKKTRSTLVLDEINLLRDAYRADPEATLDLIERILKAGKTH